jgi:hypothetical protein
MIQKIEFENHIGLLDTKTGAVEFYELVFSSIIKAIRILRYVKPANYTSWLGESDFGLEDSETGLRYAWSLNN